MNSYGWLFEASLQCLLRSSSLDEIGCYFLQCHGATIQTADLIRQAQYTILTLRTRTKFRIRYYKFSYR